MPIVELQDQREPEPGSAALARHEVLLVVQQRPVLDKFIQIHRPATAADPLPHPGRYAALPTQPRPKPRSTLVCLWWQRSYRHFRREFSKAEGVSVSTRGWSVIQGAKCRGFVGSELGVDGRQVAVVFVEGE
jgi:hypothetical protein